MTPYSLEQLTAGHRAELLAEASEASLARAAHRPVHAHRRPRTRRSLVSVLGRMLPVLRPRRIG